eukprot:3250665-Pyramimonas_sp.AAC.2
MRAFMVTRNNILGEPGGTHAKSRVTRTPQLSPRSTQEQSRSTTCLSNTSSSRSTGDEPTRGTQYTRSVRFDQKSTR